MEEKDIKAIEDFIIIYEDDKLETDFIADREQFNAIKKLLKAYKQDEEMIEEMAEMLVRVPSDSEIVNYINRHLEEKIKEVIDFFRKKCE